MRAIVCREFGWPQTLSVEDIDVPRLAAGSVLVRVVAAGVNFADSLMIAGKYQVQFAPPFVPGVEFAGTVVEAADDVAGFAPGDRVMGQVDGGAYAEYVLADAARIVRLPDAMPMDVGAAFFIAYGTAYCGLADRARLSAGESVLVQGAGGGVGLAAVEVAAALGASVIGTARGAEKLDVVKAHGAGHAFDYTESDIRDTVLRMTADAGVDVVFDTIGGAVTTSSLRCLKWEGRIVIVGFTSGQIAQIPANHLLVKNCDVIGLFWGPYYLKRPASIGIAFQRLFSWYEAGKLRPRIAAHFPLEQTGEAINRLLAREFSGKVVINIG